MGSAPNSRASGVISARSDWLYMGAGGLASFSLYKCWPRLRVVPRDGFLRAFAFNAPSTASLLRLVV